MAELRFVFLIGAARSGTKFLRDTLAASSDVAAVPYDINYIWRHGNENCPHDELTAGDISAKTAAHIRRSIARLALKSHGGDAKIVLEKTVSNTLRMDMIRHIFPEAEFIYLERSGLDVIESSYRQWTMPADRSYLLKKLRYFPLNEWRYALWFAKNLVKPDDAVPIWGPRYSGISADLETYGTAQTCALQWQRSVELARSAIADDTSVVYYEQLANTKTGVQQVLNNLGVRDGEVVRRSFGERFRLTSSWPGALPASDIDEIRELVRATGELQ